jgi:hypothetical protein
MLLFYTISLISLIFVYLAERYNKYLILIVSVACLAWLCGMRDVSVGTDTQKYYDSFETIMNGGRVFDYDIGFYIITKTILSLTNSIPWAFTIIALLTTWMIFHVLWHYRDRASVTFMAFVFICFFYPQMFNIVRQMLALSIVFIGTVWLDKKKPLFFLLFLLIASLVHLSALVCIGIYFLYVYQTIKHKIHFVLFLLSFLAVIIYAYDAILQTYYTRFAYMYEDYQSTVGYEVIAQSLLIAFMFVTNMKRILKSPEYVKISLLCMAGLFLSIITADAGEASRIAYYYTIFEVIFASLVIRKCPNRMIGYSGFVFLALLNYVYRIRVSGWYGIYQYLLTSN